MQNRILNLLLIFLAVNLHADGLMMPTENEYPKDFLRHRSSKIFVQIHGMLAETAVYSEFENEWTEETDAVYSFPLPPDARATAFYYWVDDKVYKAVLKVKEQSTNPGTGEGGVAAEVNKYLGRNAIRVQLSDIKAGAIQKIELQYVQVCDYYQGEIQYTFPLAGGDFTDYPLDHLEVNMVIRSENPIISHNLDFNTNVKVTQTDSNRLTVNIVKPKSYVQNDLRFLYTVDQSELGVDFYSVLHDSLGGHFNLFIRPAGEVAASEVYNRRTFFLISRSVSMSGYKLEQSISAIGQCLDLLNQDDEFNLIVFASDVRSWKTRPIKATSSNIAAAKQYLSTLDSRWGDSLEEAIEQALNQIPSDDMINSIISFTDGYSAVDPRLIAEKNTSQTGIFPVGIGDKLSRTRLEMIASLNYGHVTYFEEDDNIRAGIIRLFKQISQPVMKQVTMEYAKSDLTHILPEKIPALYAGSALFMAGLYTNPGQSAISIAGSSPIGIKAFDALLDFSASSAENRFAASIWAKERIDALEREVDIYGETSDLKEEIITLSLTYNIRCMYTAYIADYLTLPGDGDTGPWEGGASSVKDVTLPESCLLSCYPNPFNPETTLRFLISEADAGNIQKFIKIYNALGQLVAVYDISHLRPGIHTYRLKAVNFWGESLPSGVYFVRLAIGAKVSTIRVSVVK